MEEPEGLQAFFHLMPGMAAKLFKSFPVGIFFVFFLCFSGLSLSLCSYILFPSSNWDFPHRQVPLLGGALRQLTVEVRTIRLTYIVWSSSSESGQWESSLTSTARSTGKGTRFGTRTKEDYSGSYENGPHTIPKEWSEGAPTYWPGRPGPTMENHSFGGGVSGRKRRVLYGWISP